MFFLIQNMVMEKHFNPCIDCHAKMFAVAKRVMEGEGASFLISGEVMGQRPMSTK
jgi:hypothetical protein